VIDGRAKEWLEAGGFFEWEPAQPMGDARKLKVFHAERGDPDAPLLLLVHGFPTSSIDWYDVAEPLAADHRLCVVDFPGFGFSDKPKGARYTLGSDADVLAHYLGEVLGATSGAVVAHDRGDSVALTFAARCAAGDADFELQHLVLSNGNMFLPLSNLNPFQRLALDPSTAPQVIETATPEMLATGMGQNTFTPARPADDPTVEALRQTFAWNDGIAVLHDTIQYLVERSEHEEEWLEALASSSVPLTVIWGIYDVVSPPRVVSYLWDTYLSTKPGANELWFLPRANHYLQNDQPREFAEVVLTSLAGRSPEAPGPISAEPGAGILVDRSRTALPSAKDVLSGT
jgi:pimeloyl-ACP methyl ester carboxylesterase